MDRSKNSKKRNKIRAVDVMGGKCCICGYNKCLSALEFHHNEEKRNGEITVSKLIYSSSWEKIKEELKKCILVCSNCHREIHDEENGIKDTDYINPHKRMWYIKICEQCHNEYETTREDSIYCSPLCSQISQRKVIRPSKEELIELIKNYKWIEIGRIFGVSDNAVRKWAKKYKILETNFVL